MSRSKRTQKQIEDTEATKFDYVGDKKVEEKLEEMVSAIADRVKARIVKEALIRKLSK